MRLDQRVQGIPESLSSSMDMQYDEANFVDTENKFTRAAHNLTSVAENSQEENCETENENNRGCLKNSGSGNQISTQVQFVLHSKKV